MKNADCNNMKGCYWNCFLEIFGLILIVIATVLTIATLSALGIAFLFLAGMSLCCHKCFFHRGHNHGVCSKCGCEECHCSTTPTTTTKKK